MPLCKTCMAGHRLMLRAINGSPHGVSRQRPKATDADASAALPPWHECRGFTRILMSTHPKIPSTQFHSISCKKAQDDIDLSFWKMRAYATAEVFLSTMVLINAVAVLMLTLKWGPVPVMLSFFVLSLVVGGAGLAISLWASRHQSMPSQALMRWSFTTIGEKTSL